MYFDLSLHVVFDSQFLISTFLILLELMSLYYVYILRGKSKNLRLDNKDYEFMMNENNVINIMLIYFMININEYIHGNFNILQYSKFEKRELKLSIYNNILCILFFI